MKLYVTEQVRTYSDFSCETDVDIFFNFYEALKVLENKVDRWKISERERCIFENLSEEDFLSAIDSFKVQDYISPSKGIAEIRYIYEDGEEYFFQIKVIDKQLPSKKLVTLIDVDNNDVMAIVETNNKYTSGCSSEMTSNICKVIGQIKNENDEWTCSDIIDEIGKERDFVTIYC